MINLDTFYKKLHVQTKEKGKVYKKLFKLVEKKFPGLKPSVAKLYITDNERTLRLL